MRSDLNRTLNPLNRNLTPGGSTGGESALITFRGSPLGVGSDIGDFRFRYPEKFLAVYDLMLGARWISSYPCCMLWHLLITPLIMALSALRYKVWLGWSGGSSKRQWALGQDSG